jgi:phosphocarrier protein HPr
VNDGTSPATADAEIGTVRRTLQITNKRGLHARAAAKFVRTVGQFDCQVKVAFKGQEVSGLSIMGRQAVEVMAALSTLIESKFGED